MEYEPLVRIEHGNAFGKIIERFVVGALLADDLFTSVFGIGNVNGDAGCAAGDRTDAYLQSAQLSADDGRAGLIDRFAVFDGLACEIGGILIELQITSDGLIQRLRFQRRKIFRVRPFEFQRAVHPPCHEGRCRPHLQECGGIAGDDFPAGFEATLGAALLHAAHAGVQDPHDSASACRAAVDFDIDAVRRRYLQRERQTFAAQP